MILGLYKTFKALKKEGVLGINQRVGKYILPHNPRRLYPLVDNKIKTYELAKENNVAQPKHYFHIQSHGDLKNLFKHIGQLGSCVIKPAHGAMGNGILIIHSINQDVEVESGKLFVTSKGPMGIKKLKYFISDILSGLYSLTGQPDQVVVQECLAATKTLSPFCYKGIPDVRVIVFKGYPVMAMLRCPTSLSNGRANLHQGAVGCGISLRTGEVESAIHLNQNVVAHPDTAREFRDLILPSWKELLVLSSRCFEFTGMGYLGIDMVYDLDEAPMLLEMNARPGLAIQNANQVGLSRRLEYILQNGRELSVEDKVNFSVDAFY